MGNLRVLKPARVAGESAAHRRVCSDLGCGRSARHARRSEGERLWRTQCVPIDRTLRESLPWARPSRTRGRRGVSAPPLRAKTGAPAAARPPSVTLPPPLRPALSIVSSLLAVPLLGLRACCATELRRRTRRHRRSIIAHAPSRSRRRSASSSARMRSATASSCSLRSSTASDDAHATAASPATQTRRRTRRHGRLQRTHSRDRAAAAPLCLHACARRRMPHAPRPLER